MPENARRHPATWFVVLALLAAVLVDPAPTMIAMVTPPAGSRPVVARERPEPLDRRTAPLRVVALGDSVPAGTGCACEPFPDLVAQELGRRTGRAATSTNLAVGGEDSADLLDRLGDATVRRHLTAADVVLVEIGANDFDEGSADEQPCPATPASRCPAARLRTMHANLQRIVDAIQPVPRPADARIVLLGYWNVFRDGDVGRSRGATYVVNSAALTAAVNADVLAVATRSRELYADALTPIKGDGSFDATFALAPDGNHPNDRGHELLAGAVITALTAAGALDG